MKNSLLLVKTISRHITSFTKMLNWYKPELLVLLFSCFLFINSAIAEPPSHDPSTMIRNTDGRYWIFTTGNGIWCMSSSNANFTDWRAENAPFANGYPSWISNYVDGFNGFFWAPDVIKIGSTYYLYYSCAGNGAPAAIGLATASNLNGPWTDRGMIVAGDNAIDPAVYMDNGKLWMAWGNWQSGIDICELNPSNGLRLNSSWTHLVSGQVEGPGLIKNGNYYYLFYQRGLCCSGVNSTYYMVVARSTQITGPYSGERIFLPNQNGNIIGPGHFGYGEGKLTYHYYDGNNNGSPTLKITTLGWNNGWPVTDNITVSARGTQGGEQIELVAGGSTIGTFTLTTSYANYTASGSSDVQVHFINDAGGLDVQIDYVIIDGNTLQAEDQPTNTGVWQNGSCGGSYSEWIHCNGYIDFSVTTPTYYTIKNRHSSKVIDIPNASMDNNVLIQQFTDYNYTSQQFEFVDVGNGYNILKARHSGKALRASGSNVVQYTFYDTYWTEMFQTIDAGNGYYLLKNRHANKCLRIENSSYDNGAKIILVDCNASYYSQQFSFTPTTLKSAEAVKGSEIISGIGHKKINIYPNPADELLNMVLPVEFQNGALISIYNNLGQSVYSGVSSANLSSIDISDISRGIYVFSIKNGQEVITYKFIKK